MKEKRYYTFDARFIERKEENIKEKRKNFSKFKKADKFKAKLNEIDLFGKRSSEL